MRFNGTPASDGKFMAIVNSQTGSRVLLSDDYQPARIPASSLHPGFSLPPSYAQSYTPPHIPIPQPIPTRLFYKESSTQTVTKKRKYCCFI